MNIKVKICGITNSDDAKLAITSGADYIGFIFADSPRQVNRDTVKRIISELSNDGLLTKTKTVGVFVNTPAQDIEECMRVTGMDCIQLHGDETSDITNAYRFLWFKAVRIADMADVDALFTKKDLSWNCSRILVDTGIKSIYGGTGRRISKELALYAKDKIKFTGMEFFLAGGINPENVYDIVTSIQPDGIDVSSGVEESKGKKSRRKMEKLFHEIGNAKEKAALSRFAAGMRNTFD